MATIREFLYDRGVFIDKIPKTRRSDFEHWAFLDDNRKKVFLNQLRTIPKQIILNSYADDPWMQNFVLNGWEYATGAAVLKSKPWNISLPIADVCNAKCTFCTSWLEGKEFLPLEKIEAFKDVLITSRQFGLAGHGEPLIHPRLHDLLALFNKFLDPRCVGYVITNGIRLGQFIDSLINARIRSFNISLNAASSEIHEAVMGLGPLAFNLITESVAKLKSRLEENRLSYWISISLVVTQDNLHQIKDFIALGAELGVTNVQLKTLAGQSSGELPGLNYHVLPPYLHPNFSFWQQEARRAVNKYRDKINIICDLESWQVPIFPPEIEQKFLKDPPAFVSREAALKNKEIRGWYRSYGKYLKASRGEKFDDVFDDDGQNPFGRAPRYSCDAVYSKLYVNDFSYRMVPCCYMGEVPGHQPIIWDGTFDFMEAWNSEAMVNLRTRLFKGPLFRMCTRCPAKY